MAIERVLIFNGARRSFEANGVDERYVRFALFMPETDIKIWKGVRHLYCEVLDRRLCVTYIEPSPGVAIVQEAWWTR